MNNKSDANCNSGYFANVPDQNCRGQGGDTDEVCGNASGSDEDGNCGKAVQTGASGVGPNKTDQDQGCSSSDPDGNCGIAQGKGANNFDEDQHCNSKSAVDLLCGDCDDSHSSDEHCAKSVSGTIDPDGLCGHAHSGYLPNWTAPVSCVGQVNHGF